MPGSPVLLVATHVDRRPGLASETILKWEEEVLGKAVVLRNRTTARGPGFPPIMQSVVMDCMNHEDVEMLLEDVYRIAQQMRHPKTNVLLLAEPYPRSYQELQALVEVKVRNLCIERRVAPVLRHEELIDYVRSLTVANPNGLDQDEEEFNLACRFLNEAGSIVHYRSTQAGTSDLYFLDPQWLFRALATIINTISQRKSAVVQGGEWPFYFQAVSLPTSMYRSFLSLMEDHNIIVKLDFTKDTYMVPALLPDVPPPEYPTYDLSSNLDDVVVQYLELNFLPPPLFPQLVARVLLYIRQISAQLLSVSMESEREEGLGWVGPVPGMPSSMASRLSVSSFNRRSQSYHLDQLGYLSRDDLDLGDKDSLQRLKKIWGLSVASLASNSSTSSRHKQLTEKLVAMAQPILQPQSQSSRSSSPVHGEVDSQSSHGDEFASYLFWNKGLFCEFPCGTKFWLEACTTALAIVVRGALLPRVKVLSFLSSSVDALVDECYSGTKVSSYSPCLKCLASFWQTSSGRESLGDFSSRRGTSASAVRVSSSLEDNFPTPDKLPNGSHGDNIHGDENSGVETRPFSDYQDDFTVTEDAEDSITEVEQYHEISMNEFSEKILYLHKRQPQPSPTLSFSGSKFSLRQLSPYLSPPPDHAHSGSINQDDRPDVACLDSRLILFSLETTVQQSIMSSSIPCPSCNSRVSLETISPHVMLVDFKNSYRLRAKDIVFAEDEASTLGRGGFGKVSKVLVSGCV